MSCCGDGQTAYCSKTPCGCRKLREKLERPPSFMGWAYATVALMPEWLAAFFCLVIISAFVYDAWRTFR